MKSKDLIRQVLDKYQDEQVNIASDSAKEILTDEIHALLSKHYFIFKKNEHIVDPSLIPERTTVEEGESLPPKTHDEWMEEMRKYPHRDNHMD